jgi:hypothetical protein
MKGVSYITDSHNRRKAVVIDLKTIVESQDGVEDLLDSIVAEYRKNEPTEEWEQVKKKLKSKD